MAPAISDLLSLVERRPLRSPTRTVQEPPSDLVADHDRSFKLEWVDQTDHDLMLFGNGEDLQSARVIGDDVHLSQRFTVDALMAALLPDGDCESEPLALDRLDLAIMAQWNDHARVLHEEAAAAVQQALGIERETAEGLVEKLTHDGPLERQGADVVLHPALAEAASLLDHGAVLRFAAVVPAGPSPTMHVIDATGGPFLAFSAVDEFEGVLLVRAGCRQGRSLAVAFLRDPPGGWPLPGATAADEIRSAWRTQALAPEAPAARSLQLRPGPDELQAAAAEIDSTPHLEGLPAPLEAALACIRYGSATVRLDRPGHPPIVWRVFAGLAACASAADVRIVPLEHLAGQVLSEAGIRADDAAASSSVRLPRGIGEEDLSPLSAKASESGVSGSLRVDVEVATGHGTAVVAWISKPHGGGLVANEHDRLVVVPADGLAIAGTIVDAMASILEAPSATSRPAAT